MGGQLVWFQPRDYGSLGKVLSDARKGVGFTQKDLGKKLGKPQSFVSSYEIGQRRVDLLEFIKIATVLGLNPGDLFAQILRSGFYSKPKH
jgi:transcriptional regulator with XRE-family HTH domain